MEKTKNITKKVLCFLLVFLILFEIFITVIAINSKAAEVEVDITKSSVKDDLASMDEDKLSYLSSEHNKFIAMAQYYDLSGNLRTYVYVNYIGDRVDDLTIKLSTSVMDENGNITESYKDYDMLYVDNDSTWYKLEVLGLTNLKETTRRYKLNSINVYGGDFFSGDRINCGNKVYIFNGISNNTIQVFKQEVETITITDKLVYSVCYGFDNSFFEFLGHDGKFGVNKTYSDCFYMFFNTDKKMDNLLEVEITYKPYDFHYETHKVTSTSTAFTENKIQKQIELHESDYDEQATIVYGEQETVVIKPGTTKVVAKDNWWHSYETKYKELDNIVKLSDDGFFDTWGNFFTTSSISSKYSWGVQFFVSEKYTSSKVGMYYPTEVLMIDGKGVSNTAILRLKYEVNGIVKNAYAVDVPTDDFTGGSYDEENDKKWFDQILDVLELILLCVFLAIFSGPITFVLQALVKFLTELVKILLNLLSLPFKLIGSLFKKRE